MSGTLSDFVGPGTATYSILDAAADYGAPPVGSTGACTAAGDCYTLAVSDPSPRPATHWDATVFERVSGGGALHWTVHVGRSFADVPVSGAFYRFVETMLHRSITAGCGGGLYCPGDAASREQMAVFVLVAKEAAGYAPPACATPMFNDVPAGSAFCRFIEELARRGVVSGCGGGSYCPTSPVTREQMAVFALRTLDPTLDPPACGAPRFNDVPASSPFCRWIEELARRGVVTGCGGGSYCPTAPVTREQMAAFIGVTFGLTLYGP